MKCIRLVLATLVFASLVPAGCSTDLLGPDFAADFTLKGACADVYFFAVDAVDEVMLTFSTPGLVAAARAAGAPVTTVLSLPDADVVLMVEQGSRVSDAMCDDVIENGGPRVSRTWNAVAGSATVIVRPGASEFDARADLVLEGVVFQDGDGHRRSIDSFVWSDVSVGWLPG
jgi:hypothetical protein